ncbi:MAG: cell division protein ZapA [Alphaproteobacteria bacterium]|nr:cell division protein ZapA [Alphaproteobacteria bacterium]
MAEVTISINGRNYGVACDDGQEQRVSELGQYIDKRLKDIASAGAATTESHLLVLTALVLADEIHDLSAGVTPQPQQQSEGHEYTAEEQEALGNAVEHLNQRVLQIANHLKEAA